MFLPFLPPFWNFDDLQIFEIIFVQKPIAEKLRPSAPSSCLLVHEIIIDGDEGVPAVSTPGCIDTKMMADLGRQDPLNQLTV